VNGGLANGPFTLTPTLSLGEREKTSRFKGSKSIGHFGQISRYIFRGFARLALPADRVRF
jgi:hypothetical protein